MTTNARTPMLINVLEEQLLTNMRPATLAEIGSFVVRSMTIRRTNVSDIRNWATQVI